MSNNNIAPSTQANNTSSPYKSLNSKTNDFTSKAKGYLSEGTEQIGRTGAKAFEEVENMTSDLIQQARTQLTAFATRSLELVKKNPVIAIAAAVTVGLVVAKMMRKNPSQSDQHQAKSNH